MTYDLSLTEENKVILTINLPSGLSNIELKLIDYKKSESIISSSDYSLSDDTITYVLPENLCKIEGEFKYYVTATDYESEHIEINVHLCEEKNEQQLIEITSNEYCIVMKCGCDFLVKLLPSGDGSLEYWHSLKNGTYLYNMTLSTLEGAPTGYAFVEVTRYFKEFSVIWYQQASGSIYRKSGNHKAMSDWQLISRNNALIETSKNPVGELTIWEGNFSSGSDAGWQYIGTNYNLALAVLDRFPLREGYTRKYKLVIDYTTTNAEGFYVKFTRSDESAYKEYIGHNVWGSTDDGVRAYDILDFDLNFLLGYHNHIHVTTGFATQSWYRVYKLAVLVYDVLE